MVTHFRFTTYRLRPFVIELSSTKYAARKVPTVGQTDRTQDYAATIIRSVLLIRYSEIGALGKLFAVFVLSFAI